MLRKRVAFGYIARILSAPKALESTTGAGSRLIDGRKSSEPVVPYFSAMRADADCIVSRDPAHFHASDIPVYSPREFLAACSFA